MTIDTKNLRALAEAADATTMLALLDALERKDKLMRDLLAALKLDRHETEDWPTDSRKAIEAITKELTP